MSVNDLVVLARSASSVDELAAVERHANNYFRRFLGFGATSREKATVDTALQESLERLCAEESWVGRST